MAYRNYSNQNRHGKATYGKKFTTKRGRYGCYKYVNGRRVGFVSKKKTYRRRRY